MKEEFYRQCEWCGKVIKDSKSIPLIKKNGDFIRICHFCKTFRKMRVYQ